MKDINGRDIEFLLGEIILEELRSGKTEDGRPGALALLFWGSSDFNSIECGLSFLVQCSKITGKVIITYEISTDLCDIKIYDLQNVLKRNFNKICCDNLVSIIDSYIS